MVHFHFGINEVLLIKERGNNEIFFSTPIVFICADTQLTQVPAKKLDGSGHMN